MATGDRRVLKLVDGLKARPALNGAVVEVQSYDSASGRHVVLTTDLESLKLKPSNLLDFADAPPPLLSDARDRGTAAYKARRFHEAVEWYTLAAKADVRVMQWPVIYQSSRRSSGPAAIPLGRRCSFAPTLGRRSLPLPP